MKNNTILFRNWKLACFSSWGIFLLYQILIITQSYAFPHQPLCNHNIMSNGHASFYSFASAAAVGGFFFTSIMIFMKILVARPGKERIPRILVLNVVLIGLLSNVLFVVFNWNGVCIDVLG